MASPWARSEQWYIEHANPSLDRDFADGLGLTLEEYNLLKPRIETAAIRLYPAGTTFRGNRGAEAKRRVIGAFCDAVTEFKRAPSGWRERAAMKAMGFGRSNANRRRMRGSTTGTASPVPEPAPTMPMPVSTGSQPQATPNAPEPVRVEHHALQPPQREALLPALTSAPAASSGIGALLLNIKGSRVEHGLALPACNIIPEDGGSADFDLLKKQLLTPRYGKLPQPSAAIYTAHISGETVRIQGNSTLNMVLNEIATKGELIVHVTARERRNQPASLSSVSSQHLREHEATPHSFVLPTRRSTPLHSKRDESILSIRGRKRAASPQPSPETERGDSLASVKRARVEAASVRGTPEGSIDVPIECEDDEEESPSAKDENDVDMRDAHGDASAPDSSSDDEVPETPQDVQHARAEDEVGDDFTSSSPSDGEEPEPPQSAQHSRAEDEDDAESHAASAPDHDASDGDRRGSDGPATPAHNDLVSKEPKNASGQDAPAGSPGDPIEIPDDVSSDVQGPIDEQDEDAPLDVGGGNDEDMDAEELDRGELERRNVAMFQTAFSSEADETNNLAAQLGRVTPDIMRLILRYLPLLNEDELRNDPKEIVLPNWGLSPNFRFSAYQLAYIVWAFRKERGVVPGGILADETGLGKTLETLGHHTMECLHQDNVLEVEEARKKGLTTHLPKGNGPGARCPTGMRQPLACICVDDNEDLYAHPYCHEPPRGVTLVFTTGSGLPSFRDDARRMLEDGEILRRPNPPRLAIHVAQLVPHETTRPLSPDEIASICREGDWEPSLEKERTQRTMKVNNTWQTMDWASPTFKGPAASDPEATSLRAPRRASRFMIITTRPSFDKHVQEAFTRRRTATWQWSSTAKCHLSEQEEVVLQPRRIYWDECQVDVGGKVIPRAIKLLSGPFRKAYGTTPAIWGSSGTPDRGNPIEPLQWLVDFLRTSHWRAKAGNAHGRTGENATLATLTKAAVVSKCKQFNKLCAVAKVDPGAAAKKPEYRRLINFAHRMLPIFYMRRTSETLWYNGKPILAWESVLVKEEIFTEPSRAEAAYIKRWEAQVGAEVDRKHKANMIAWKASGARATQKPVRPDTSKTASYYTARTAIIIPQIVEAWEKRSDGAKAGGSCSLKDELVQDWVHKSNRIPLCKLLRDVDFINVNTKFLASAVLLERIKAETRVDGSRCKAVLATRVPLVFNVWMEGLQQRFGKNSLVTMESGMSAESHEDARNTFSHDEDHWILLCNFGKAANGVNLQRANYIFMIEPSHLHHELVQYFARTNRRGQIQPSCFGFTLVHEASSIERRMVGSTNFHKDLQTSVLKGTLKAQRSVEVIEVE